MRTLRFALIAAAFAAATAAIGWLGVLLVGLADGALTARQRGGALLTGLAAMTSWAALLLLQSARAPIGRVATVLSGVLSVKPVGVYALTLCFAGLLALTSALMMRGVVRLSATR